MYAKPVEEAEKEQGLTLGKRWPKIGTGYHHSTRYHIISKRTTETKEQQKIATYDVVSFVSRTIEKWSCLAFLVGLLHSMSVTTVVRTTNFVVAVAILCFFLFSSTTRTTTSKPGPTTKTPQRRTHSL
jgi:hypothetical protein